MHFLTQRMFCCHDRRMDPIQNSPLQSVVTQSTESLPQQPTMPSSPDNTQNTWMKPLLLVLGIAAFMVLATLSIFLFVGRSPKSNNLYAISPTPVVSIATSGTVYFQGYAPQGSYIAIAARKEGQGDFADVVSGITPDDDGTTEWTWKDATPGQNYEIKATLKVSGKVVQSSPVEDVSAPATSVGITLVSQLAPPAPTPATVSGQINLDGYAPQGATLQVLAKVVGAVAFSPIVTGLAPSDNVAWSWVQAVLGKSYQVQGQLVDVNGNVISTGDTQTVTAPSGGELLNVASTANPPAPTVTGVSGTITLNGAVPSGAYITLATRPAGTTTFNQVASNISASNGVAFSWNGANSGQQYDVQAYMWVNGKPYAQSSVLTVTAPSTNDVLTINAQQPTQAPPSGSFNVSCGGISGGLVQASINFNTQANLPNAASYNIVVTSASQNTQVVNTTVTPPNPTQSQSITTTYVFQPGATYYAQYAYSTSTGGQMSALSPSVQFACQ